MKRMAFTLTELLVVMAILLVLLMISGALVSTGKERAHTAVSVSNLRQNGFALNLYVTEYGGSFVNLPDFSVAQSVIPAETACDPADTWHATCPRADYVAPIIGSYAYVRGTRPWLESEESWHRWVSEDQPFGMMASIFHSNRKVRYFEGTIKHPLDARQLHFFHLPEKVLILYSDTSVRFIYYENPRPNGNWMRMSWYLVFDSTLR